MSNGNGDLNPHYLGDGASSNPSEAFFYEQNTGIYHDTTTYPNTAWTLVKKGNKRIRVDDNQTYLYGTVAIDNLIPGTTGDTVTLSNGTFSHPSLNFSSSTNSGMYWDTTGSYGPNPSVAITNQSDPVLLIGNIETDLATALLITYNGTPSNTALAIGQPNNGFYSTAPGNINLVTNGTEILNANTAVITAETPLTINKGIFSATSLDSVTTPSYSWTSDNKTGIYHPSPNGLGLTCGGTEILGLNTTSVTPFKPILGPSLGSTSAPQYSFQGETNSGFFRSDVGLLGIGNAGVTSLVTTNEPSTQIFGQLSAPIIYPSGQVLGGTDTSSAPTYSWASDTKTGLYLAGTHQLGVSSFGTNVGTFTSNGLIQPLASQMWTVAALGSAGSETAITFTTPASTPAALVPLLTYAQSTTTGDTWTIIQPGIYNIRYYRGGITNSGTVYFGVSRNIIGTTSILSWTPAQIIGYRISNSTLDGNNGTENYTSHLAAGDVIRLCVQGGVSAISPTWWFEITYIAGTTT